MIDREKNHKYIEILREFQRCRTSPIGYATYNKYNSESITSAIDYAIDYLESIDLDKEYYKFLEDTYDQTLDIVEEFLNKEGQNKCHYYPDLFNKLAELYSLKTHNLDTLPPRKEFEEGCKKHQDELYGKSPLCDLYEKYRPKDPLNPLVQKKTRKCSYVLSYYNWQSNRSDVRNPRILAVSDNKEKLLGMIEKFDSQYGYYIFERELVKSININVPEPVYNPLVDGYPREHLFIEEVECV